jgi:uncharacterized repeat protein (TIGR03803 family)
MRGRRVGRVVRIRFLCVALALPSVAQAQYSVDILREFNALRNGEALPRADSFVQASDGNFYGLTTAGGFDGLGTLFRLTPSGRFTTVYTFTGGQDGAFPSSLVLGRDGGLFGTTYGAGARAGGTLFRFSLDGRISVLHAFDPVVEGHHVWGLIAGIDGNLYGLTSTTSTGRDHATFYRATINGDLTLLHTFTGDTPASGPVPVSNGDFYGVTFGGLVFRLTASGAFSAVRQFSATDFSPVGLAELMVQGPDGEIYGAHVCDGKMFRMSLAGNLTFLPAIGTSCVSSFGRQSAVSLTRDTDGTILAAINSPGRPAVIFRIGAAGEKTPVHDFGSFLLMDRVIRAYDGRIYGVGFHVGPRVSDVFAAIFRVNLPITYFPISVTASPTGGGVALRWTAPAGVTNFTVTRLVTGHAPVVVAIGLTAATFTVPLGVAGSDASYVVTAVDASGEPLASAPMHVPWGLPGSRTPTIATVRDYDGDGKADVTIYRSSTAQWFTRRSSDGAATQLSWGAPALLDRPVPADYDGDGKSDVAIYRETTGEWFITRSSDATSSQLAWGAPALDDLPVPADYDGDGRVDVAVYRATTGEWFVRRSSNGALLHVAWGAPLLGDSPVPSDYDGDGRADIAVYRNTTAEWYVHSSAAAGLLYFQWGSDANGDVPVPADYDGDGRSDVAVYRSTTGDWFIAGTTAGGVHLAWGSPALGDVPVAADYTGDGRADPAVYRFSSGEWFILANGQLLQVGWGAPHLGDAVRKY